MALRVSELQQWLDKTTHQNGIYPEFVEILPSLLNELQACTTEDFERLVSVLLPGILPNELLQFPRFGPFEDGEHLQVLTHVESMETEVKRQVAEFAKRAALLALSRIRDEPRTNALQLALFFANRESLRACIDPRSSWPHGYSDQLILTDLLSTEISRGAAYRSYFDALMSKHPSPLAETLRDIHSWDGLQDVEVVRAFLPSDPNSLKVWHAYMLQRQFTELAVQYLRQCIAAQGSNSITADFLWGNIALLERNGAIPLDEFMGVVKGFGIDDARESHGVRTWASRRVRAALSL